MGHKILIIEDNEQNLYLVTFILEAHGYEVVQAREGKEGIELSPEVWKVLYKYTWPGNVRELENVIERAVVLSSNGAIKVEDLPEELTDAKTKFDMDSLLPPNTRLPDALEHIEEKLIRRALAQCDNVQSHAAQILGITKSLMQHKIKKYNIEE